MRISGRLKRKTFGRGSKSEYDAVYIETDKGEEYVLRQVGKNPRQDPELVALIGKYVRASGSVFDYLFLANEVQELNDEK
jgi:hypothetical protein